MQGGNCVKLIQDSSKQARSSCNFIFRLCCYHQPAFWCDYITWISSALSKWNRLYLEYSTVSWKIDSIQFSTFWHTTGIHLRVHMVVAIHSDLQTQSRNIPIPGKFLFDIIYVIYIYKLINEWKYCQIFFCHCLCECEDRKNWLLTLQSFLNSLRPISNCYQNDIVAELTHWYIPWLC